MLNKKAQSAMEYLMTYGWAILVVLIALGALFYLGVFSPRTPNTCTAIAPFTCADVKADETSDDVLVSIGASGLSGTVSIADFVVTSPTGHACNVNTTVANSPITIPASTLASAITQVTCGEEAGKTLTKGSKLIGTVDATYTLSGSTTTHTTTIQFSGTVE